jgi:hypothetical protein
MQEMQKFAGLPQRLQECLSDPGQDTPNSAADRRSFGNSLVSFLGGTPLRVALDRDAAPCTGSFSAGWVMPAF